MNWGRARRLMMDYRNSVQHAPPGVRRNPNPNAGLIRERGNCEVCETKDITSQIRH